MTITVTMLQTRRGEDGNLWTVGNSYAASDNFAHFLIGSNYATGTVPLPAPSSLSAAEVAAVRSMVTGAWDAIAPAHCADRGFTPNSGSADTTNKWFNLELSVRIMRTVSSLRVGVPNYGVQGGSPNYGSGGTLTITGSVEYPTGTFTPLTWAGANPGSIANSQMGEGFAAVSIPRGARVKIRLWGSNPTGLVYSGQGFGPLDKCQASATALTDYTMTGGQPSTTGYLYHPPAYIAGDTAGDAVLVLGDSLQAEQGGTVNGAGHTGPVMRALAPSMPVSVVGAGGSTLQTWVSTLTTGSNRPIPGVQLAYFNKVVIALGTNDFVAGRLAGAVGTSGTALYDLAQIISKLPGKEIYVVLPPPRATDGTNTTAATGASEAALFRTAVLNGIAGVTAVFDCYTPLAGATEGLFAQTAWAGDGTHVSKPAYLLLANAIPATRVLRTPA